MKEVIVITGSSRGIGAATALLAARQGYAVCVNYVRDAQAAGELCARIVAEGGEAIAVQADVSEEADVARLFDELDARLGTLTALVNNVGVLERKCRLADMSVQRLERVLRTNVISYFLCCQQAVRRMSTANGGQGGRIVNVSSVAARIGSPEEYIDYAASKGAVDTLTLGLAKEVAAEASASTACAPASSTRTSTLRAANRAGWRAWPRACPCSGAASRRKSPTPSSTCWGRARPM